MPRPIKNFVKLLRREQVFAYDKKRFQRNHANSNPYRTTRLQVEGKLNFFAHSLEKGLSHDRIRFQFGANALKGLSEAMQSYLRLGFDTGLVSYQNALSVLREYISVHERAHEDVSRLQNFFPAAILEEARDCDNNLGGTVRIHARDKINNRSKSFNELFSNRWSVREFAPSPVSLDLIEEAISITTKTPSVCNRQSGGVRVLTDLELISKVLTVQGGFTGYATPPVLLLVTTDSSSFLGDTERNQIYTDGGLLSMSLLLALEYVSLAACPLNAMFSVRDEGMLRDLLKIPERENIIMFIAVGNFQEENSVPKSFRYPAMQVLTEIDPILVG